VKEGLKQRLIGAFVLLALAVIFLPGFFKQQQGHQVDTHTLIPPQPQIDVVEFNKPEIGLVVEPAPAPEAMFIPADDAPVTTAEPLVNPEETSAQLSPVPELPLNDKGIPDAWVVQVVSLSSQSAAMKLRDELQSDGHRAYVREITTDSGTYNRVFIGPKLSKTEALAVKAQIDQRLKVSSQVKRFEP
jgi:DedD protein